MLACIKASIEEGRDTFEAERVRLSEEALAELVESRLEEED